MSGHFLSLIRIDLEKGYRALSAWYLCGCALGEENKDPAPLTGSSCKDSVSWCVDAIVPPLARQSIALHQSSSSLVASPSCPSSAGVCGFSPYSWQGQLVLVTRGIWKLTQFLRLCRGLVREPRSTHFTGFQPKALKPDRQNQDSVPLAEP